MFENRDQSVLVSCERTTKAGETCTFAPSLKKTGCPVLLRHSSWPGYRRTKLG